MRIRYEQGSSILHRLSPLTKLIVLISYSISIFLVNSLEAEALIFAIMLAIVISLRSKALLSLVASRYFLSFAALIVAVQALFTGGGEIILSIPLALFSIQVTTGGLYSGLAIALRFLTIIMGSAIFIYTTDPNELAYALMRAGLPYRFGFMLVTAIRFIPVFEAEAGMVRDAQAARGLEIDRAGAKGLFKAARYTLMPLIVSALSKVDSLVISMEGRAFGRMRRRTFTRVARFSLADALISLASVSAMSALVLCILLA